LLESNKISDLFCSSVEVILQSELCMEFEIIYVALGFVELKCCDALKRFSIFEANSVLLNRIYATKKHQEAL